jgi:hypothetical protein
MNVKGKFVPEERLHGKEWCSVPRFFKVNFDGFVKNHQICFRWLSKKFDIQGAVIFQVRDNTYGMSSA